MIAVDAMGGDNAPKEPCEGAILACKKNHELEIALVGDEEKIKPFIEQAESSVRPRLHIIKADDVIRGDDSPSMAIRKKKHSSMVIGFEMIRSGELDGIVSAGNTGAIAAGGVLILGRIKGIDRPGLGSMFPSVGRPTLLLDVGATVRCKPLNLYQFALMGSVYMNIFNNVENPSVKLLNIGTEQIKGDDAIIGAREMILKNPDINYQGFIEANELPESGTDVAVCDGFTGNVIIKFGEGLGDLLKKEFKAEFANHLLPKLGIALMYPALKRSMARFEWEKMGHAPLLGVNGTVVKVHGRSSSKAFCYALLSADEFAKGNGIGRIKEAIDSEKHTADLKNGDE